MNCKSITKHSNHYHVITFDSHLKAALIEKTEIKLNHKKGKNIVGKTRVCGEKPLVTEQRTKKPSPLSCTASNNYC